MLARTNASLFSDTHCYVLAQLHIHKGEYGKAIADFEEMFANGETELEEDEILCVLFQIAFCATKSGQQEVAQNALKEIKVLQKGKSADFGEYWNELNDMAASIKQTKTYSLLSNEICNMLGQ